MISGDRMRKRIIVKRKHRYLHEVDVMYKGHCDFEHKDGCIKLQYREENNEGYCLVEVLAHKDFMMIKRHGETASELTFRMDETTKGYLNSAYGTIDIDIKTFKYIRKENVITLEYDIETGGSVANGYHIVWNIKEE